MNNMPYDLIYCVMWLWHRSMGCGNEKHSLGWMISDLCIIVQAH